MLEKIVDKLKKLSQGANQPVTEEAKRLAAAALLIEAARRDSDFADSERATIVRVVGENFHLNDEDAQNLVTMAEERQKLPYGESIFTRTVASSFSEAERKEVLQMIWKVALADGHLGRLEDIMVHRVAVEIGLTAADADAARKIVEASK
ncbi:MAG: TerB family tellurite resistance protein [Parvibaculum sp.]|jgi:uncharacterized tellurite resistance protein B-like protein